MIRRALVMLAMMGCQPPASAPVSWSDAGTGARGAHAHATLECPPAAYPQPREEARGRCSPDLPECLAALEPGECYYAQPGECAECMEHARYACATARGGCDDEYGAIECCRQAECPDGEGTCLQRALFPGGACHPVVTAFDACAHESAGPGGACAGYAEVCMVDAHR